MAINTWQPEERPREKMMQKGAKSLSDAELLAIFLRTGVRGKSAIELAQILLKKYGNILCKNTKFARYIWHWFGKSHYY